MKITQFSKVTCPPCQIAKVLIEQLQVNNKFDYEYIDLRKNLTIEQKLLVTNSNQKRLPIIVKDNGEFIEYYRGSVNKKDIRKFIKND